jgi:predicted ester cyclase
VPGVLLRTAFPELRYTIEDVVAAGDPVAVHETGRGTQLGCSGASANRHADLLHGVLIWRFAAGKRAERWAEPDLLGLLQQRGAQALPRPGAP